MPVHSTEPPLLVTAKDAARLLGISERKLWNLSFEQHPPLPYLKIGRLVRYDRADLLRFIQTAKGGHQ